MPWRPPICPPRPTDGRGRCPGASGPPQSGGPAHQPGQLAPGAVRPYSLAGAGRGPAPPVPIAPPGAPSRCPAAASGFGGAFAVCSRSSAPAPRLRAGPAHRAGPLLRRGRGCGSPFGGRGRGRFPPPPPALAYRRVRSSVAGPPGCPPSPPAAPPGGGGGPGGAALPRRPGVGPPSPAPPGRPGSPLLPSGRPCVGWAALRLLRARPCGRSLRASGPAPPRRGAAGPLRGPVGPLCGPPAGAPAPVRRGPFGPFLAAVRQLARGAGWQGI